MRWPRWRYRLIERGIFVSQKTRRCDEQRGLQIYLLGDLKIVRHGQILALPPSKKTRALLAYLVATGRPHLRERLCYLLWEGPDDPRVALRWSLTKLRPLLNADGTARLDADRERVAFAPHGADVDVARLATIISNDVSNATTHDLKDAAALFSGCCPGSGTAHSNGGSNAVLRA